MTSRTTLAAPTAEGLAAVVRMIDRDGSHDDRELVKAVMRVARADLAHRWALTRRDELPPESIGHGAKINDVLATAARHDNAIADIVAIVRDDAL